MRNKDYLLAENDVDGTVGMSFHATAEHGDFMEMEEIENSSKRKFAKGDFEQAQEREGGKVKE